MSSHFLPAPTCLGGHLHASRALTCCHLSGHTTAGAVLLPRLCWLGERFCLGAAGWGSAAAKALLAGGVLLPRLRWLGGAATKALLARGVLLSYLQGDLV